MHKSKLLEEDLPGLGKKSTSAAEAKRWRETEKKGKQGSMAIIVTAYGGAWAVGAALEIVSHVLLQLVPAIQAKVLTEEKDAKPRYYATT